MINVPADPRLHPDICVHMYSEADMVTGDGVFANTDLCRIPYDGWLLINASVTASGDSEIMVPQIGHQENAANNIPVVNAGVAPAGHQIPWYKVPIQKGMTPRIIYNEVSDTKLSIVGAFYRGMENPVALNTPDILHMRKATASNANICTMVAAGGSNYRSDLEDTPYPGWLYIWGSSNAADDQLQVMTAGHRPGNYTLLPQIASGLAVNVTDHPALKTYVPSGGQPTATYTKVSGTAAFFVCAMYIDWQNVSKSIKSRLGL